MVDPDGTPPRPLNRLRWVVFALAVAGVVVFLTHGPDEQTVIRESGRWRAAAREHLFAALAAFFAVEVVLIALSAPIGIWLTVLAGFLFGTWLGTAVVNAGSTLGAILAFLLARYMFADALRRAAANRPWLARPLAAIDRGFQEHGAYYLLLLRLTPVFPFWALNLGLGLTRVRLVTYWWATQLGTLPMTLVAANAGASLAEITSFREVISARVLGALCLLPLVPLVLRHTAGRLLRARSSPARG